MQITSLEVENVKRLRAAGAQVWIERVGKGAECSVVIEDVEVIQ